MFDTEQWDSKSSEGFEKLKKEGLALPDEDEPPSPGLEDIVKKPEGRST